MEVTIKRYNTLWELHHLHHRVYHHHPRLPDPSRDPNHDPNHTIATTTTVASVVAILQVVVVIPWMFPKRHNEIIPPLRLYHPPNRSQKSSSRHNRHPDHHRNYGYMCRTVSASIQTLRLLRYFPKIIIILLQRHPLYHEPIITFLPLIRRTV